MSHRYNQRVFADADIASPLLYSYIRLIGIELALKNWDRANWSMGHQIDAMIAGLGRPALQALAQRLGGILTRLWCEQKGGGASRGSSSNYPTIRYLRHDSDFLGSIDTSSDSDLADLKNAVDDLADELKREGILI